MQCELILQSKFYQLVNSKYITSKRDATKSHIWNKIFWNNFAYKINICGTKCPECINSNWGKKAVYRVFFIVTYCGSVSKIKATSSGKQFSHSNSYNSYAMKSGSLTMLPWISALRTFSNVPAFLTYFYLPDCTSVIKSKQTAPKACITYCNQKADIVVTSPSLPTMNTNKTSNNHMLPLIPVQYLVT